jgi:hypothetical protein
MLRADFFQELRRVGRVVDAAYVSGRSDMVFKGKWYGVLLEHDLRSDPVLNRAQLDALPRRVGSCLGATLNFDAPWADHYVEAIQDVVK